MTRKTDIVVESGRPRSGAPHPFVIGDGTVQRCGTMVPECAQAGLAAGR